MHLTTLSCPRCKGPRKELKKIHVPYSGEVKICKYSLDILQILYQLLVEFYENTMKVGGLVFASIISGVVAFEIAGAYERVFFWYAREIDIQNGRNPPRIAPNCPPPCSFNQFIAFINDPDLIPRPNLVDERVRKPEVTRTIRALIDNGLTGTYDDGRIIGTYSKMDSTAGR